MDTSGTGARERQKPSDDDEAAPRKGDKPDVIARVATGAVRPGDVDEGTDEARALAEEEHGALEWLLSAEQPPPWEVEVQYLTPRGTKPLVFVVVPMDGREITNIEERNTSGSGPAVTRKLDEIANNAELVAAATLYIEDPKTGERMDPGSPEFRGQMPSKATAIERRFAKQSGLLMGVAGQVRSISGYNSDHVGKARQRAVSDELVSAVGGS